MRNPITVQPTLFQHFCKGFPSLAPLLASAVLGCSTTLHLTAAQAQGTRFPGPPINSAWVAQTQSPANAPAELTQLLSDMDAAANRRDIQAVMQFYSPNFTHSDGWNRPSLEKALTQLWERYADLKYRTEVQSWKAEGSAFVAETVTTITGTQKLESREMALKSTIRSQQRFEGQKLVKQEVLAEKTQLTSGKNPPTTQINLPEQVKVGEEYNFDAIVQEPLGNDILLGTVVEETVAEKTFLTPPSFELELLNSGGVFKVGKAPANPENRWLSAILMRQGGITMITQRLRVVK